jgi:hypothetical protein
MKFANNLTKSILLFNAISVSILTTFITDRSNHVIASLSELRDRDPIAFQYGSVSQRLKSPLMTQSSPTRTNIGKNIYLTEPYPIAFNPTKILLIANHWHYDSS